VEICRHGYKINIITRVMKWHLLVSCKDKSCVTDLLHWANRCRSADKEPRQSCYDTHTILFVLVLAHISL